MLISTSIVGESISKLIIKVENELVNFLEPKHLSHINILTEKS